MSNFAERLRQAMFDKHCKAVDVVRGTKIGASVISRYLSRMNQPSRDNLLALGKFLEVTPEWLLSSSDDPESSRSPKHISSDKDKIITVQEELIKSLQKQVLAQSHYIQALFKQFEETKAKSKERHTKGREKTKNPTKPNKQKVGFLKKYKKPKK